MNARFAVNLALLLAVLCFSVTLAKFRKHKLVQGPESKITSGIVIEGNPGYHTSFVSEFTNESFSKYGGGVEGEGTKIKYSMKTHNPSDNSAENKTGSSNRSKDEESSNNLLQIKSKKISAFLNID